MKILQINSYLPIYDVFNGIGWKNWTRVKVDKRKGEVKIIAGLPLQYEQKVALNDHFFKGLQLK